MKKIFLFVGVVMALSLAACGEKANQPSNETSDVDSTLVDSTVVADSVDPDVTVIIL